MVYVVTSTLSWADWHVKKTRESATNFTIDFIVIVFEVWLIFHPKLNDQKRSVKVKYVTVG